jgi:glycerate kinase
MVDVNKIAGSGAAGGLGGGCSVFFNSQLHRGVDLMFSLTNF